MNTTCYVSFSENGQQVVEKNVALGSVREERATARYVLPEGRLDGQEMVENGETRNE